MFSMTGYGYSEKNYEKSFISVEIKSVNSRFLDLSINLPPFLNSLESHYRNLISKNIYRGKVDVFIRIKEFQSDCEIYADTNMAKSYYNAIKKISDDLGFASETIPLSLIIQQVGVLNSNKSYDAENYKELIDPLFNEALTMFINERKREGENLKLDLLSKLENLQKCADFFQDFVPKMESLFKEQLYAKFKELVQDQIDENRIATELAVMLVKYTISEEVVRLQSHLKALRNEIEFNEAPGKKIDFLCQEINREINTTGSKNQFAELGEVVIQAKDSLENIREQAKNVE